MSHLGVGRDRRDLVVVGAWALDSMRRFRAMVGLLRERDGLDVVAELHLKPLRRRRDGEVTVAHATDEVEGLLGRLVQSEPERVLVDLGLHGRAHG